MASIEKVNVEFVVALRPDELKLIGQSLRANAEGTTLQPPVREQCRLLNIKLLELRCKYSQQVLEQTIGAYSRACSIPEIEDEPTTHDCDHDYDTPELHPECGFCRARVSMKEKR